jgi:hypothetical protein
VRLADHHDEVQVAADPPVAARVRAKVAQPQQLRVPRRELAREPSGGRLNLGAIRPFEYARIR